jgi:hypothetical protein
MMAQRVHYTAHMPRVRFTALMDFTEFRQNVLDSLTLTKSDIWAYEREWRIISSLRDKLKTYEILPFAPEEIGEVYLGCAMTAGDRAEIISITRDMYPTAHVFQVEKRSDEFSLTFRKIDD